MDQEEIGNTMKKIFYLIIILLVPVLSCQDRDKYNVKFSYQGIIDKEYRFSVGRVIPVTIGQSVETDGDISRDGKYFYYSSNSDGGNYDIYLRSMTDITTVKLTSHPSKDITPVISPDGRHLAFVSFRDDPEGDIFTMKIKPEKLIEKQEESVSGQESLDSIANNITIDRDRESGVIINIKDANPVWSPDGNYIAYSSSKGGTSNIWIMRHNGSDKRQVTQKGGQFPSFSPDGKKIVFISYRENENGDVYAVEVDSGKEKRITSDKNIKLYPSFMNDESRIIYSSIEHDTNKNGSLDLQDRSVIKFMDLKNNLSYPVTKYSESSFKAKWLPVLQTRDYSGVIIYTDITGENINLNIIPETGIIPKKLNAKLQYEMCETYIAEYDDTEKYLMSLESVYNYYGRNRDNASQAYVDRALEEAAFYYKKSGYAQEFKRIFSFLRKRAEAKDQYASFIIDMIEKGGRETAIETVEKKFGADKAGAYYIPFALEDTGDVFFTKGSFASAAKVYGHILAKYPAFERVLDIQTKISQCTDDLRKTDFSSSAINVLNKGNANQKIIIIKHLIDPFTVSGISSSEADSYLKKISAVREKLKDDKKIMAVISHIAGLLYDIKGQVQKSRDELQQSITLSHPNDLTYYLSNIKLGEIERRSAKYAEAEKYYSAGIGRYSRRFKTENFRDKLLWLINYYDQTGDRAESGGNFKSASETYDKLINLITLMHNKRLYPEVYSEFAAKAHVKYIDSYTAWKGEKSITELEKSYNEKLPVFRMDFNRAAIYGLGYIYTKKGLYLNSLDAENSEINMQEEVYEALKAADAQVNWALFIDDTFIEPYLLKSCIYQFVDSARSAGGDGADKYTGKFFPKHLWEENIVLLEKALNVNDEKQKPENEGNIHLNMGNNYFLLLNYPRALKSYRLAEKYKKNFGSDIEKALFHFHLGYTLWQNSEIKDARNEIKKAYEIYNSLSVISGTEKYKNQFLVLYRYFALFSRYEEKYAEAITWYRKIIKFARDNKIEIDSARYLQEIASCYIKTGDFERAKTYLDRAAAALEKYPSDEKKSRYQVKLLGIIPFNIGADAIVIGGNKIFYPLDTLSKKLLNISMLEEIAIASSDYGSVIKYLKEKIKLLEDSGTAMAAEVKIRSLNNLGYYSYISGKFSDAESYFIKAGELSTEKNDLSGISTSMMNLVNLYSLMIEDEKHSEIKWKEKITGLITKIDSFRKNYYNMRLSQEKESLKQKARLRKIEVTEEQISEATARVEQETASIYFSLDISSAVMKYYLAELLYGSDPVLSDKKMPAPESLYSVNRDIYSLYSGSLKSFESAIIAADKNNNKELKARLLVNTGVCYERTGEYEKAYVALLDAKNISEQNGFSWIKINANHRLGLFLDAHGKTVEGGESGSLAEKYFSTAISEIEEYPVLYTQYANRVKIIYRDYIDFLIEKGREGRAFELAEKFSQVARIIYVNSLSPEFGNEYDRKKYYDYTSEAGKLGQLMKDMSSLLISGKTAVSPEMIALKKTISQKNEKLRSILKEIRTEYGTIRPYVEIPGYKIPSTAYEIYRFHETGRGIFYWKVTKGKMTSGYLKGNADTLISGKEPVFVLLNDTAVNMAVKGIIKTGTGCVFIPSLDRINDYLNDSNFMAGNILSEEKGIRSAVPDTDVTEGENQSFAGYSLIIDKKDTGNDMTPDLLFSATVSPVCLVQTGVKADYQYLLTLMEGALYAGTKRVIITSGTGSDTVLPVLKKIFASAEINPSAQVMALGYINIYSSGTGSDIKKASEKEYTLFSSYMKKADFSKASVHLARWNSMQKEKNSYPYINSLWLIELLSGRIKESLKAIDSRVPVNDAEKSAGRFMKAYTFIYAGDIPAAENELKNMPAGAAQYSDTGLLEGIIRLIRSGNVSVYDKISGIKSSDKLVLPAERYLALASKFMMLYDPGKAEKISDRIPVDAFLSTTEHLMRNIISGISPSSGRSIRLKNILNAEYPPSGRSIRYDRIAALKKIKDPAALRDEAQKLLYGEKGYDHLSVYPVLETVILHGGKDKDEEILQFLGSVDPKRLIPPADPAAAVMLLMKADALYATGEDYAERAVILNYLEEICSRNSLDSVKKETLLSSAINYSLMENYEESFKKALAAEELFTPQDKNYADLQLLRMDLYIRSGKYKEAATKGILLGKMTDLSPDRKYMLNLQLSLLELDRLRSLKKAASADAAEFEKLFSSALSLAKHDTELLNRKGYREISAQVFDEYINYKMRTGQHTDAHYYNEVKKLLIASSRCGINLFKYTSGMIDMAAVQQSLPENGLYVNVARNKDDLFVWTADKKTKRALIIENGYDSFMKFKARNEKVFISGKDLNRISGELTAILSPLAGIMKGRNVILVSVDSFTENIPFEITGGDRMTAENSLLLYIPSLLVSTADTVAFTREVFIPETDSSLQSHLGKTAIREAGIKFSTKTGSGKGLVHIASRISFNLKEKKFTAGGKNISGLISKASGMFASSDSIKGAGYNDFLLASRSLDLQAAVFDSSAIQDTNSAVFIGEYYQAIEKGSPVQEAFFSAINKVRAVNRYSHPSYWSGIRLNIYNLNLLKQK